MEEMDWKEQAGPDVDAGTPEIQAQEENETAAPAAQEPGGEWELPEESLQGEGQSVFSPERGGQADFEDERLTEYRLREQDGRLLSKQETRDVYRSLRDEVLEVMDYCRKNGHPEVDVQSAFQAVAGKNLGKIYEQARDDAQRRVMQRMQANEQATPGRLSGGSAQRENRFAHMSDREFDRYLEMAYRGELQDKAF